MDKAKQYIGLAAKARRAVVGAQAVESSIKAGKAQLVIVDSNSSQNTQKKYADMCKTYRVNWCLMDNPCLMAGKPGRMCVAICDASLAEQIQKEILREHNSGGKG